MPLRIGKAIFDDGPKGFVPTTRKELMSQLRKIGQSLDVKGIYFVRATKAFYGGHYNPATQKIVVVEQSGARKIPRAMLMFRFFHELAHHIQTHSNLFPAYYFKRVQLEDGSWKEFSVAERRRVALRAERHADSSAIQIAEFLYKIKYAQGKKYSKEFLEKHHKEIYA